jgi:hypothetical protein
LEHPLTEFTAELRHHCRNPKCQSKLKAPVTNPRNAFCARGCNTGFYRSRCRVCEQSFERRNERQHICSRRKCRAAFKLDKAHYLRFSSNDASSSIHPLKKAAKTGVRRGTQRAASWRFVAGELTALQFHCATVPDGPDCDWKGGDLERTERRNQAALDAHFDKLDAEAVARDFCVVCRREDDLTDRAGETVCHGCCEQRGKAMHGPWQIPADLSIPDFLKRAA